MLDRLSRIVGAEGVRPPADAGRWAVHGTPAGAVVAPATAEEAAAVLALASAEGWAVELAGAGGHPGAGRPPAKVDLVVTTARLAGVRAYEPADLVASAGAGSTLGELGEHFAPHRQWLPLDPPAGRSSTIGAVAATAAAGPLRRGYGTPRDHVLGLQLVTGDGRVLELGGRVVKNVAGYDLVKLVVGSRGTLGLVTRVDVRLRALPGRDRTVMLAAAEPDPLLDAAQALRAERVEPVALELVAERAGETAGAAAAARAEAAPGANAAPGADAAPGSKPVDAPGATAADPAWRLLARFQGNAEAVEDAAERLARLAGGVRQVALSEAGAAEAWAALDRFEATAGLVARLADRPAALPETLALARRLCAAAGTGAIAAHAGDGIVRVLVTAAGAGAGAGSGSDAGAGSGAGIEALAGRWAAALGEARTELAGRGGTLIVARGPRALLERLDPWGEVGPALELMRGLKREFDPAGVLAPGRFVV